MQHNYTDVERFLKYSIYSEFKCKLIIIGQDNYILQAFNIITCSNTLDAMLDNAIGI